jgi:hypothetical protein
VTKGDEVGPQRKPFDRRVERRLLALGIFAAALALLTYARASSTPSVPEPQDRQQQNRRRRARPAAQTARSTARNYSRFRHEDHRRPVADLKCSDCHTIPSAAEPDTIAAATNPRSSGYPDHDSCVRCHRQQFFKGASPQICTVCHTRASPRLSARDMQPFPKQGEQTIAREFPGYFPHGLHQSVIASKTLPPALGLNEGWSAAHVSFTGGQAGDAPARALDNCATCHLTDERAPVALPVGGSEGAFRPEAAGTFKTVPSGHASCFNCHWQSQPPLKDDCAGCHLPPGDFAAQRRATEPAALPGVLASKAAAWFKGWPRDWPRRLSLKFRHQTENHDLGCTTCHINITQMETLNIPKADVPIASCAPCHIQASPVLRSEGAPVTISSEMGAEAADKDNRSHTCIGCHTSVIGRERPPCSHRLVLGQKCEE